MKVKFKRVRKGAKLPTKNYETDFCYDVYACDCEEVAPNVYKYPLGFALQIDDDEHICLLNYENRIYYKANLSVDIRPRSSIYKTGMSLCNSPGTCDKNYIGEVCLYFYHVMPDMPKYEPGDRIAQMKIGITVPIDFIEVEELNETDRGDKGFGSSGIA